MDISYKRDWHCGNINLSHSVTKFEKTEIVPTNNFDVVYLHFGLKGGCTFSLKRLNKSFDAIGGHHNLMYFNEPGAEIQNKSHSVEIFGIKFQKEVFINFTQNADDNLKRFSENVLFGKSALLSPKWGVIDFSIEQVIRQIINSHYTNELEKLFLLSKSIELLVLSASACNCYQNKKEIFIKTKNEKEKIIAARDLINEKLVCPPSLSEIARIVDLNEYKLKQGFKELFNMTVFNYLMEQRLNLAFQYIKDTKMSAAEISFNLGYSSPQHFNKAFKKKFGIAPNSFRNNL